MEQAANILGQPQFPAYQSKQDGKALCRNLSKKIDTLMNLSRRLTCPAKESCVKSSDDTASEESRNKQFPSTTQCVRKNQMPTVERKGLGQGYLTAEGEQILCTHTAANFLKDGSTSISEYVREGARVVKRKCLMDLGEHQMVQRVKRPGKNWSNPFLERHQEELQIEKVRGRGWQRKSLLLGDKIADFVASLSDVEQLCLGCAKITAEFKSMMTRARLNQPRRLHNFIRGNQSQRPLNTEKLWITGNASSCKLCCFVLACSRSWNWPIASRYSLDVYYMDNILGPTFSKNKILLSLKIEDEHSEKGHRGWIVPTLLDDVGHVSDPSWSPLDSTVNFKVVQEWLEFCDSHHKNGCRMANRDDIPYFRLIDCESRSIYEAPPGGKFAALSYCWGPDQPLPKNKLDKLPEVVPLVIEDALNVARRLSIPYLWVDRYCNEQQEDSPIKYEQLRNMHKVYRSAYVTIVAGYGDRPEFGLPGMSSKGRKPQSSVDTHGHRLVCIPDVVRDIENCPWSTRGWTLQERLLSRRRLVFTETQAFFQCWNMHCCEAIPKDIKKSHKKNLSQFKEVDRTFEVFPQKGIGKTGAEIEERIQEYLKRRLTKESDALNAFLGGFQAFQEIEHPVHNFWGLPMSRFRWTKDVVPQRNGFTEIDQLYSTFLSSLAWTNDPHDHTNSYPLARRQGFPSWTWAAWKSLSKFSRKSITNESVSPSVKFLSHKGDLTNLENYEQMLGSGNSLSIFQPCILLSGWVTTLWFSEEGSGGDTVPKFKVQSPIPTHRVSILADFKTLEQFRQKSVAEPFRVLLLGGTPSEYKAAITFYYWKDVRAIILQSLPDNTYMRLGVVTWSCLGRPSIDEDRGLMRVKEVFEARRVTPSCNRECQVSMESSFDRYLEDDSSLMEFEKVAIQLV